VTVTDERGSEREERLQGRGSGLRGGNHVISRRTRRVGSAVCTSGSEAVCVRTLAKTGGEGKETGGGASIRFVLELVFEGNGRPL